METFSADEVTRIFIAKNVNEAEEIEQLLTENEIKYAIELEPFFISAFHSERMGAVFYVLSDQGAFCRKIIAEQGLDAGLIYEDEE
ncbi:MAG: hypothetical protein GY795_29740 [Desulfobacterales bacterium]|nr:hypothetical protein [Desulfobacterales bacterium]